VTTSHTPHPVAPEGVAVRLDARTVEAVVLDADGVLTDSQELRLAAWQDTLEAYLAQYAHVTGDPQPGLGTLEDLAAQLSGRLDEEAAAGFLREHRLRTDLARQYLGPSGNDLLRLLVRHEEQVFLDRLHTRGARARAGAARLLLDLRASGIRTAAVSTGRHCEQVLRSAGLVHLLDTCVDGDDALHNQLSGPPGPALYQLALRLLHVTAARAVLLADTQPGLTAGSLAGFSQVVAVTHGKDPRAAYPAGPGRAVRGLEDVTIAS